MRQTHNSIAQSDRTAIVSVLNPLVVDATDLYLQIKMAHWSMRGPNFISVHRLLDEFSAAVLEHIDSIAERSVQLGGIPEATADSIVANSRLTKYPPGVTKVLELVTVLADRYAYLAEDVRKSIGTIDELSDPVSADILTRVADDLEKSTWFLESFVEP